MQINKLKSLLNTSLLSNRHKQYLSKEEEKQNKKDTVLKVKDDNVYVKGIGGYDGTNAGQPGVKTLQEVIESILENDIKDINLPAWDRERIDNVSKSEFAALLGCSEADIDEIFASNIGKLTVSIDTIYLGFGYKLLKVGNTYNNTLVVFGSTPMNDTGFGVTFGYENDTYSAIWYEV